MANTQYAYNAPPRSSQSGRRNRSGGGTGSRQVMRSSAASPRSGRSSQRGLSTSVRSAGNRSRRESASPYGSRSTETRQARSGRSGNARSSYRSGGASSTRYDHRVGQPRRVPTVREREEIRQRKLKKRRMLERKRRARNARLLALLVVCAILFGVYKTVTGITSYIDKSRENAKMAMQDIDIVTKNDAIDVSDGLAGSAAGAAGADTAAAAAETSAADPANADPTHVFSNGRYVDTTKPMVALTFDDGPRAEYGNRIMDALEAVNGRGTFFMVGNLVSKYPEEVQRMAADGHELANHSYDHDDKLSKKGTDYIQNEFNKANAAIQEVSGVTPTLLRLPGGIISEDVKSSVTMPMIYWSVDTKDWKSRDAASVISVVQSGIQDGDIVLMHEIYDSTATAVEQLAPWLTEQGFQLVTVSELIQFHQADVQGGNGKQYSNFPPKETPAETSAAETSAAVSAESAQQAAAAPAETAAPAKTETQAETASNGMQLAPAKAVKTKSASAAAAATEAPAQNVVEENAEGGPGSGDVLEVSDDLPMAG